MAGIALKTLGCRLNQAETAEIEAAFAARGLARTRDDDADVIVVNTCTVTAESSRSSRQLIRRAVRANPGAEIVVTGCYAVVAPDEIASIGGVDLIIPDKERIAEIVRPATSPVPLVVDGPATSRAPTTITGPALGHQPIRSALKVQTGCDESCTFCIVPMTRGPLASRPVDEVIARAGAMADAGAREITLTGVHLGRYGEDLDDGIRLTRLTEILLESLPDEVRVRLSSLEVTCVEDALLELIERDDRLCRHLHLPLQSGDDDVLARMGRPYTSSQYLEVVSRARALIPELAVTADVMVGFPGETSKAFENTLATVASAALSKLHVFRYSERAETPASRMTGQIAHGVKAERSRRLRVVGEELRLEFTRQVVDRNRFLPALVEVVGPSDGTAKSDRDLVALTDNYIKIESRGPAGLFGRLVDFEIGEVSASNVRGLPQRRGSGRPG